jgi:ABC-type sulfate transport system substrate-binding protein
MTLATIDGDFGGWKKAHAEGLDEGGSFGATFAQAIRGRNG